MLVESIWYDWLKIVSKHIKLRFVYVMIKEWGDENHLFWGSHANIVPMSDSVVMNVFLPEVEICI